MKKKIICIGIIGLFLLVGANGVFAENLKTNIKNDEDATSGLLLDQYVVLEERDSEYQSWDLDLGKPVAQSFIPSKATLSKVSIKIYQPLEMDAIKLSIKGELEGSDLVTMQVNPKTNSLWVKWVDFDFNDIQVTPGHTYYIVVESYDSPDESGFKGWFYHDEYDSYEDGTYYYYNQDDNEWKEGVNDEYDFTFKTYSEGETSSDLIVTGSIEFLDLDPKSTESPTGSFTIKNTGTDQQTLDWQLIEKPETGDSAWFNIDILDGVLENDDEITVDVICKSIPDEYDWSFDGDIILKNNFNGETKSVNINISTCEEKTKAKTKQTGESEQEKPLGVNYVWGVFFPSLLKSYTFDEYPDYTFVIPIYCRAGGIYTFEDYKNDGTVIGFPFSSHYYLRLGPFVAGSIPWSKDLYPIVETIEKLDVI